MVITYKYLSHKVPSLLFRALELVHEISDVLQRGVIGLHTGHVFAHLLPNTSAAPGGGGGICNENYIESTKKLNASNF